MANVSRSDNVVNYVNYDEQVKQWTNVFGIGQTPKLTSNNDPQSNYIKRVSSGVSNAGLCIFCFEEMSSSQNT